MLFFFSATGNSLYVAQRIASELGEKEPVSIAQAIHNTDAVYSDETIGFVYPIYAHLPPEIVKSFISTATFKTPYLYVVYTYGNASRGADEYAQQIFHEEGYELAYVHGVLMVDNWLPGYDVAEQTAMDKPTESDIEESVSAIRARKHEILQATPEERAAHLKTLQHGAAIWAMRHGEFLAIDSSACTGCGICSRVCPHGDFSISEATGTAIHNHGYCELCLGCVNACPTGALGLTVPERNAEARWRNPNISLAAIMKANSQAD